MRKRITLLLVALSCGFASIATDVTLDGTWSYVISQSSKTVRLYGDKMTNNSSTGTSGTLKMRLYATSSQYSGGSITGYNLGEYTFTSTLSPNYYFYDIDHTVTLTNAPSSGTYYLTLVLLEYQSGTYYIIDYVNFNSTVTFGSGGGTTTSISAPSSVYAYYSSSSNAINFSWGSVSNASYYNVYRSTSAYGTYSYISYTYSTSYNDYSGYSGTTYYYKVTAVSSGGTESDYSSYDYATMGSGSSTTSIYAPSNVSAYYYTSYNNIYVSWSSVSNASSYQVYRSTTMYGTYTYVTSVYTTSYTDADITYGNTYYYAIKAVNISAVASSLSNSAYATVTYYNNGYANDVKDVEVQKATISIYPNPTTDYINIKVATGTSDNATIVILDISGRFVYNGKRGDEVSSVDVSSFAEGTYFVEILDNNTIVGKQSFIVKR